MKSKFLLALLFSAPAAAEPSVVFTLPVPQELVVWVEAKTGTKLPEDQKIAVVENNNRIFGGGNALHSLGDAAYMGGTIYFPIRSIVHFQETTYQALAIHELVHETQDFNGRTYACTGQREAEAYFYQNQYLSEHRQILIRTANEIASMNVCDGKF